MAEDIEPPRTRLRGNQYHEPLPWEVKPTNTTPRIRVAGLEVMEYMSLRKMSLPVVLFQLAGNVDDSCHGIGRHNW